MTRADPQIFAMHERQRQIATGAAPPRKSVAPTVAEYLTREFY
jgi:hypothetical protein